MDELIRELIEFVKTASPIMWEASYRQVYMAAIQDFVVAGIAVFLSIASLIWGKRLWKKAHRNEYVSDDDLIAPIFFFFIFVLGTATSIYITLGMALIKLLNPSYYAIEILLDMVNFTQR